MTCVSPLPPAPLATPRPRPALVVVGLPSSQRRRVAAVSAVGELSGHSNTYVLAGAFPILFSRKDLVMAPRPQSRISRTCLRPATRVDATKGVSSVCQPLPPDRPLWFPGSSPPEWLDGSLPGDFGFDPLGLGSDPELLRWFAQAELMHSRWAMLAVAGILIPECLERLGFIDNFSWYDAGAQQYFADPVTLFVVQMALMAWVEGRRWADFIKPGCVDIEPKFPNRENPKPDVGYPGGLWFDPLMWGRGSPEPVMVLRTKEIKNGRLAMLAFVGFCFQAIYTGKDPLENLMAHLADPGHCNIFSAFTSH